MPEVGIEKLRTRKVLAKQLVIPGSNSDATLHHALTIMFRLPFGFLLISLAYASLDAQWDLYLKKVLADAPHGLQQSCVPRRFKPTKVQLLTVCLIIWKKALLASLPQLRSHMPDYAHTCPSLLLPPLRYASASYLACGSVVAGVLSG